MSAMTFRAWVLAALIGASAVLLAGCGGGGGGSRRLQRCVRDGESDALTVADVQQVIAQAVGEAQARRRQGDDRGRRPRGQRARACSRMNGARATFTITSGTRRHGGGLEGVQRCRSSSRRSRRRSPARTCRPRAMRSRRAPRARSSRALQSAAKPISRRAAVRRAVQSAVVLGPEPAGDAPERSARSAAPLGLAADPGGLPLYKNGTVVGGIGVMADGDLSVDLDIIDVDTDVDELIAVAGGSGFAAPADRRADHITVDGRTLRYVDSESIASNPAAAPPFACDRRVAGVLDQRPRLRRKPDRRRRRVRHARVGLSADRPTRRSPDSVRTSLVDAANMPSLSADSRHRRPAHASRGHADPSRAGSTSRTARARRSGGRWAPRRR